MTPSWKRQKTAPADDDTRVVEYPDAQEIPGGPLYQSSSESTTAPADDNTRVVVVENPPEAQELPWGPVELLSDTSTDTDSDSDSEVKDASIINTPPHYYDDVDEDAIASSPAHENDDDDEDFAFSPASPPPPPLTQSTEVERTTPTTSTTTTSTSTTTPTTLYVLPNSTIVLTPDGGCEYIPDQRTITPPKPSTSTANDEDPRKVCHLNMQIQNNIAALIAHQWRASAPSTVEETTVDVCRSVAFTILSAPYQDILMKYVRCAIRRPR